MDTPIQDFDDLLRAARAQAQPQQLLFVFVRAGLPEDPTPQQRADFEAGIGGEIEPLMRVGMAPEALENFEALVAEAAEFTEAADAAWALVFVSSLSGDAGRAPETADVESALDDMVERIRGGWFRGMLPFDREGRTVELGA